MRSLFSIILFFTFTVITNAQVDVSIHMHQKLGDQPFGYNTVVQTAAGYFVKVTRLEYYISEVKLIHDGGQITPVTDQYFLVAPNADSILELGNFDITLLEGIEYSLGVDAGHNHLDPASYPSSHPLAPKNPSMHWGWTAGYRFIAFEGFAGATSGAVTNNFQIHTIDDSNYKNLTLNTSGELSEGHLAIHVNADYLKMLEGINAQNGIISHTSNGASKKQMDNMQAIVFTVEETTSTTHLDPSIAFTFSPNPTSGMLNLTYDLSAFKTSELLLSDITGKIITRSIIPAVAIGYTMHVEVPNGPYIISIISDEKVIVTRKVSIHN
jgi:hypothetical protein